MTDLKAQFTDPELWAVATAIAKLGDMEAIWALADRLPLPKAAGEAAHRTVTIPDRMVQAARTGLATLPADSEPAEKVRTFLDRFDAWEPQR